MYIFFFLIRINLIIIKLQLEYINFTNNNCDSFIIAKNLEYESEFLTSTYTLNHVSGNNWNIFTEFVLLVF